MSVKHCSFNVWQSCSCCLTAMATTDKFVAIDHKCWPVHLERLKRIFKGGFNSCFFNLTGVGEDYCVVGTQHHVFKPCFPPNKAKWFQMLVLHPERWPILNWQCLYPCFPVKHLELQTGPRFAAERRELPACWHSWLWPHPCAATSGAAVSLREGPQYALIWRVWTYGWTPALYPRMNLFKQSRTLHRIWFYFLNMISMLKKLCFHRFSVVIAGMSTIVEEVRFAFSTAGSQSFVEGSRGGTTPA